MVSVIVEKILAHKLITVVRDVYGTDCVHLAKALCQGGIRLLEVTFDQANPDTWEQTANTIRSLNRELGSQMYFGAGTVTSPQLVALAKEAGAAFAVSPDCNPEVIRAAVDAGMVFIPGALTPTEVLRAHTAGAHFVKLFPAGNLGPAYLKAVAAPLNHVRLLAFGGVNETNAAAFLEAGAVGVGVAGNLVRKDWIAAGAFDRITKLAETYVSQLL